MKYTLTYGQAMGRLNRGYAVRPQSFQYTYKFVIVHDGMNCVMEIDPNDKRNISYHGEYKPGSGDDLSKWAVFNLLRCDGGH
jgi:hypothetical protein